MRKTGSTASGPLFLALSSACEPYHGPPELQRAREHEAGIEKSNLLKTAPTFNKAFLSPFDCITQLVSDSRPTETAQSL